MKIVVSVTVGLDEGEYFEATAYGQKDQFQVESLSTTGRDDGRERTELYASGTRFTKKGTLYKGGQQKRAWAFLKVADLPESIQTGLRDAGVLQPRKD